MPSDVALQHHALEPARRHTTPSLSCPNGSRDHSRFSTAYSRGPSRGHLRQSAMDRCVLRKRCRAGGTQRLPACCCPTHFEDPCLGSVCTAVVVGPARFIDLTRVFHCRHRRSRRGSINGVDFLVFRFCQSFPAIYPFVAFLVTMATLTLELG